MKYEMSVALGGVLHWGVNYVTVKPLYKHGHRGPRRRAYIEGVLIRKSLNGTPLRNLNLTPINLWEIFPSIRLNSTACSPLLSIMNRLQRFHPRTL